MRPWEFSVMLCIYQGLATAQEWGSQIADPFSLSKQKYSRRRAAMQTKAEAKNLFFPHR